MRFGKPQIQLMPDSMLNNTQSARQTEKHSMQATLPADISEGVRNDKVVLIIMLALPEGPRKLSTFWKLEVPVTNCGHIVDVHVLLPVLKHGLQVLFQDSNQILRTLPWLCSYSTM